MSAVLQVIILEDDPMIAMDLRDLCENADCEVLAMFHHPNQLLSYNGAKPDLALLDIHLGADKTGIDIAEFLIEKQLCAHIFITSFFDSRTIQDAAKTNPIAYILKPFNDQEVITNIRLAASKIQLSRNKQTPTQTESQNLFIKTSKGLISTSPDDVLFLEAEDVYTRIHLANEKHIANQSLKNLEVVFEPSGFLRVHRSYMVNLRKIDMFREDEIYIREHRIPLGRSYREAFFKNIKIV